MKKSNLIYLGFVLSVLGIAIGAATPTGNVPISAMPIATSLKTNAWIPIIQPIDGRTTNDNFRVSPLTFQAYMSTNGGSVTNIYNNTIVTNLTVISNIYVSTNIVINTNITIGGTNVATINPTDNVVPVRADDHTFIDSPISVPSTGTIQYTNSIGVGYHVQAPEFKLLSLGTNILDPTTASAWLLASPTNDAAQVSLQLKDGSGLIQWLELFNYTNGNSGNFVLPANSPISGSIGGGLVKLRGGEDWNATNGCGIMLRFVSPDWMEIQRFSVSNAVQLVSDNLWTNVTSVLYPTPADLTNSIAISTNQVSFFGGASQIYPDGTACIGPNCAISIGETATQGFIYIQDGAIGDDTSFLSTDLRLQGLPVADAGTPLITAPGILWEGSVWEPAVPIAHNVRIWANMTPEVTGSPAYSDGHLDFWFTNSTDVVGHKIFSIHSQSGYTGTGTNAFGDDGKFHPISSLGSTTINPTDDYLPYRSNATTFADSPLYFVSTNNVGLDSKLFFGPGTTNVLYRSGTGLVITNADTHLDIDFLTASGEGGRLQAYQAGGRAMLLGNGLAGAGLGVVGNSDGVTFQSTYLIPLRDNTTSLSGPGVSTWWKNLGLKGTNYIRGFESGSDVSQLTISHGGTNIGAIFNMERSGIAVNPVPITFTNQSTIVIAGTTNFITFGATNAAPVTIATPDKWISVSINGEATEYRIPLYK